MFRFMFAVPQKWWGEKMLLILSNTPISKHYCLCLNPCLDIPTKSKFYVKNLVTKHNKDLNNKSLIYRKIGPLSPSNFKGSKNWGLKRIF